MSDQKDPNLQLFHVSIAGHYGPPVTLACSIVEDTNVLVIAREEPFKERRDAGYALITNQDLPERDWLFADDHVRDSINSFFARTSRSTIAIVNSLQRHSPAQGIQKDSFDEHGPRYRLIREITNGQIAVLAACGFADIQSSVILAQSLADDFMDLYDIYTIS